MKIQTLSFAVVVAVASTLIADTLRIGAFTLPYRFEDTNVTDMARPSTAAPAATRRNGR